MLAAVKNNMFVHFVGQNVNIATVDDGGELVEIRLCGDSASWIVRDY